MLKKLLSVTVVLAMCLALSSVMPLADAAEIESFEGEGAEDSPYLICNAEDLKKLAETVNGGSNTGELEGSSLVGGIVGINEAYDSGIIIMKSCYNTGKVKGSDQFVS